MAYGAWYVSSVVSRRAFVPSSTPFWPFCAFLSLETTMVGNILPTELAFVPSGTAQATTVRPIDLEGRQDPTLSCAVCPRRYQFFRLFRHSRRSA